MTESFSVKKAEWATKQIDKAYDISIKDLSSVQIIQDLIKDNPDLNLLVYFNHISYADPAFVLWVHNQFIDPNLERQTILPASYLHTDFFHNPAFAAAFFAAEKLYGLEGVRLIQSYMIGKRYTEVQARTNHRDFIKTIKQNLKDKESGAKGALDLILSPEGHRADDGLTLQEGEKGIANLAKILTPVILFPMGLNYPNRDHNRSSLNFHRRVDVTFGEPKVVLSRNEVPEHDDLMKALAGILPEDMRGIYRQE